MQTQNRAECRVATIKLFANVFLFIASKMEAGDKEIPLQTLKENLPKLLEGTGIASPEELKIIFEQNEKETMDNFVNDLFTKNIAQLKSESEQLFGFKIKDRVLVFV